jgi:hypothetical protein
MPDSAYAEWLQSPERLVSAEDAALAGRWGDLASAGAVSSSFDSEASAIAEANRQLAFKGGPLVDEEIVVPKKINIASVRGRVCSIKISGDPDYGGGVDVFIIGGELANGTGVTKLFVLRRL